MANIQQIKDLAGILAPEIINIRHQLHMHPELSFQEFRTSQFIRDRLIDWGIPFNYPFAGTGLVGTIKGKNPEKRVIALRADMDALPIQESNSVTYQSKNPGIMHACGHDVHSSCLLGAAKILQELKETWQGTVLLIFQPGEEKHPGGASLMIRDGALDHPSPQAILGLHVEPTLEVGTLGFHSGKYMASADEIYISVKGNGGHAAAPHLSIDTVLISAQLIQSLQQIISRNRDPFVPSVLSICAINGGHTTNVIPKEVTMMGTFRSMDENWRFKAHELIKNQASELGKSLGAEISTEIKVGYPCVVNHRELTENSITLAKEYLGESSVKDSEIRMGSEDFAFYSQKIPANFFRLGTGNPSKGIISRVHTPTFDIDESAIEIGMGIMAWFGISMTFPT